MTVEGTVFEGLLQPMHLLLILGIALLVFGPKRLPELGRSLGSSIRGFKEGMNDTAGQDHRDDDGSRTPGPSSRS